MVALARLIAGALLAGPGRLVPAAAASQLIEAEAVLEAARVEAAALLRGAEEAADSVREAARLEGLAAAEAEIQDRLFDIAEAGVAALERAEERIVGLALQVAERVVGQLDGQDVVARMALRSLRLAGRSNMLRLRVNPELAEGLRARLDAEPGLTGLVAAIEIVPDPRIRDRGCIMETDAGLVDATIDSQLAAVRRGLQRALARQEG